MPKRRDKRGTNRGRSGCLSGLEKIASLVTSFNFVTLKEDDIELIRRWLDKPEVARWFGKPEEWIDEITTNLKSNWIFHYRVDWHGQPVGFAQCYKTEYAPHGPWSSQPKEYGIDYFLASDDLLGKGLGASFLNSFVDHIAKLHKPKKIIADPDKDNVRSTKSLEKSGFELEQTTGLWVKYI